MRIAFVIFAMLGALVSLPAAAQQLLPESVAVLDAFAAELATTDDPLARTEIFTNYNEAMQSLFPDDPLMRPVYTLVAAAILDDYSIKHLIDAANFALYEPSRERQIAAVRAALIGINSYGLPSRLKPIELYRLGEGLQALAAAGISREEILGGEQAGGKVYDEALAAFGGGAEPPDDGSRVVQIVEIFEPLGTLERLTEFTAATSIARTAFNNQVIGIVRIASGLPVADSDRQAVAGVQDESAAFERYRARIGQQMLEEVQRRHGEIGGVVDEIDDPVNDPYAYVPEQCRAITCDCENIGFDIAGEFKRTCILEEDKVMQSCIAGRISGYCHATAYGPAAFPKG